MQRRKFLLGIGGSSIGGGAILGSSAFTRVESQRKVEIRAAHDNEAYLGMDKCPGSPNGSYVDFDDGHLEVLMSPENENTGGNLGSGINSNLRSYFDEVFQICNQGKQIVCVWIEDLEWPMYEDGPTQEDEKRVEFYTGASAGAETLIDLEAQSIVGEENAILLEVGQCICVGIAVVSKGLEEGDRVLESLDDEIVIHADADCPGVLECVELEAEYCLGWRQDNGSIVLTSTDLSVTSVPDSGRPVDYGIALQNEANVFREIGLLGSQRNLEPGQTKQPAIDAVQLNEGYIFWEDNEACPGTQWGELDPQPTGTAFDQLADHYFITAIPDMPTGVSEWYNEGAGGVIITSEEELNEFIDDTGAIICDEAEARDKLTS